MNCNEINFFCLIEDEHDVENKKDFLAHIQSCTLCKEKYENLKMIFSTLSNYYELNECLSSKKIMKYIEGKLSKRERKNIENHLTGCKKCRNDLDYVKSVYKKEEKKKDYLSTMLKPLLIKDMVGALAKREKGFDVKKKIKKKSLKSESSEDYEIFKNKVNEEYEDKIKDE